jgi:hypothetical protein
MEKFIKEVCEAITTIPNSQLENESGGLENAIPKLRKLKYDMLNVYFPLMDFKLQIIKLLSLEGSPTNYEIVSFNYSIIIVVYLRESY